MMTFRDGPAIGERLMLRRAPIMLRVTRDGVTGIFDGLDQPGDEASPTEEIFVYRAIPGTEGSIHICARGKAHGGMYQFAEYALLPDQPADADVRTTAAWVRWCEANKARLLEGRT